MQIPSFVAVLTLAYAATTADDSNESSSEDSTMTITITRTTFEYNITSAAPFIFSNSTTSGYNNLTSAVPFVFPNSTTIGYHNLTSAAPFVFTNGTSRGYINSTSPRRSASHTSSNITITMTHLPFSLSSEYVTKSSYSKTKKPAYYHSKKPWFKFTEVPRLPFKKHTTKAAYKCCGMSKPSQAQMYEVKLAENVTSTRSAGAGSGFASTTKAGVTAAICGIIAACLI